MNTNVGDMPLDIFSDYTSDILAEEWSWEYLVFAVNGNGGSFFENQYGHGAGTGLGFGDAETYDLGNGAIRGYTVFDWDTLVYNFVNSDFDIASGGRTNIGNGHLQSYLGNG